VKRSLPGTVDRIGMNGTNLTFHLPAARQRDRRICGRLSFLGITLSESRNAETAGAISPDASRARVRVIRTDEDLMIARSVCGILEPTRETERIDHENQYRYIGTASQETRRDRC
jgi:hypothetical protein